MIDQGETNEQRGQVWECAGCGQYGPRNTPFGEAPWRWRAEDRRWVHACGVGGDAMPNPARPARVTPRTAVAAVYAAAHRQEIPRRMIAALKETVVWLLLACLLADHAPVGVLTGLVLVALVARALWCFAHAGTDFLLGLLFGAFSLARSDKR